MLFIDGLSLTLDAIGAVAAGELPTSRWLTRRASASTAPAPSSIARRAGSEAVYGINTGFGSFAEVRIEPDALDAAAAQPAAQSRRRRRRAPCRRMPCAR